MPNEKADTFLIENLKVKSGSAVGVNSLCG